MRTENSGSKSRRARRQAELLEAHAVLMNPRATPQQKFAARVLLRPKEYVPDDDVSEQAPEVAQAMANAAGNTPEWQAVVEAYNTGGDIPDAYIPLLAQLNNYFAQGQAAPGNLLPEVANQAITQWGVDAAPGGWSKFMDLAIPIAAGFLTGGAVGGTAGLTTGGAVTGATSAGMHGGSLGDIVKGGVIGGGLAYGAGQLSDWAGGATGAGGSATASDTSFFGDPINLGSSGTVGAGAVTGAAGAATGAAGATTAGALGAFANTVNAVNTSLGLSKNNPNLQLLGGAAGAGLSALQIQQIQDATQAGQQGIQTATQQGLAALNSPQYYEPQQYTPQQYQTPTITNTPYTPTTYNPTPYNPPTYTPPGTYTPQTIDAPQGFVAPDPNAVANTPEYQFALQQGLAAVDRSMGARGMLQSGNRLAALTQYGQGLASQQYQNAYQNALSGWTANTGAQYSVNALNTQAGQNAATLNAQTSLAAAGLNSTAGYNAAALNAQQQQAATAQTIQQQQYAASLAAQQQHQRAQIEQQQQQQTLNAQYQAALLNQQGQQSYNSLLANLGLNSANLLTHGAVTSANLGMAGQLAQLPIQTQGVTQGLAALGVGGVSNSANIVDTWLNTLRGAGAATASDTSFFGNQVNLGNSGANTPQYDPFDFFGNMAKGLTGP